MEKYLIVGLGNVGSEYNNTRHQVGFMVLDYFLNKYNIKTYKNIFNGDVFELDFENKKIYFAKPTTYMNLSGEFVFKFINYYKIPIQNVLIIFDDVSLEIGTFRLRRNGSAGGHNGIKSLISNLKTEEFKRLKVGILSKSKILNIPLKDYVLSKFSKTELDTLNNLYSLFSNLILDFISLDFDKLLAKYNRK